MKWLEVGSLSVGDPEEVLDKLNALLTKTINEAQKQMEEKK
jgi:hypothetical protein|tara:strand:- start:129 stop:251 length:123 start_codon:yes stop_codon:yes gene_type:complete